MSRGYDPTSQRLFAVFDVLATAIPESWKQPKRGMGHFSLKERARQNAKLSSKEGALQFGQR